MYQIITYVAYNVYAYAISDIFETIDDCLKDLAEKFDIILTNDNRFTVLNFSTNTIEEMELTLRPVYEGK